MFRQHRIDIVSISYRNRKWS